MWTLTSSWHARLDWFNPNFEKIATVPIESSWKTKYIFLADRAGALLVLTTYVATAATAIDSDWGARECGIRNERKPSEAGWCVCIFWRLRPTASQQVLAVGGWKTFIHSSSGGEKWGVKVVSHKHARTLTPNDPLQEHSRLPYGIFGKCLHSYTTAW